MNEGIIMKKSNSSKPTSSHSGPGGNWPSKTGGKSGGNRGNAVPTGGKK